MQQHARRGTTVIAASGRLRISGASVWLGDRVISETVDIREGEPHVIGHTGWVEIRALSASEVVCVANEQINLRALFLWCGTAAARLRLRWQCYAPRTGRG